MADEARSAPIFAYAIKMRGKIDLLSISESRSELVSQINRPAGQSVVPIKITEVGLRAVQNHQLEKLSDEQRETAKEG